MTTTDLAYPPRSQAWRVVAILGLITVLSYIDRQLINLLVDPIRTTLGLSDTQVSLLQGPAFIAFFLIVSLPAGRLVDRGNRRTVIAAGLIVWSVMTVMCGLASSFWQLFAARAGVGIGEACLAPAAYSLIADYFEPRLRGRAIAVIVLSGPLGAGLSFVLGGLMLSAVPGQAQVVVPIAGALFGWQLSFFVAGLAGVVAAALLLFVREVPRHETGRVDTAPPEAVRPFLRRRARPLVHLFASFGLLAFSAYAIAAWLASFYIRVLKVAPDRLGVTLGLLTILGSVSGGLLGGIASDRLASAGVRGGRLLVLPVAAGLAVPVLVTWLFVTDLTISFTCVALIHILFNVGVASTPSALQAIVPNRLRGLLVAIMTLVSGVMGAALGPVLVALVSDRVYGGDLRAALLTLTPVACLAALVLGWSGRSAYADAKREEDGTSALG